MSRRPESRTTMRNMNGSYRPPSQSTQVPPGCLALPMAAAAYLIFGAFSRVAMGQLLWGLIALVLIPALCGLAIGRRGAPNAGTAFGVCFWAMAFYTLVNLIRIRLPIGSGDFGGNVLAGFLTILVNGAIAGGVGVLAAKLRSGIRPQEVNR